MKIKVTYEPHIKQRIILPATGYNEVTCPTVACEIKYKGKVCPITGHDNPKRQLSSTLSLTLALDGGGC
jgi:hypothetical protein